MSSRYHFEGQTYDDYSGLWRAFMRARGYPPIRAYRIDGFTLYFR